MSDLLANARPYVRYGRNSKLNGRERGTNVSITEQDRSTIAIARKLDVPTWPEFLTDEDVSGQTFTRPAWERAVGLVRDGKAAGIIAHDLDRMSRAGTGETLVMIAEIEALGGAIYDQTGRLSLDDADAELITTMRAMISRRFVRGKAEQLDRDRRGSIARGVSLSCPFGYRRPERVGGRAQPLVVEPEEAKLVKLAYELRAEGHSWPKIADRLNAEGSKRWTHGMVRQAVYNETYEGIAVSGDARTEGAHPAIVSHALAAKARRVKGTKPKGGTPRLLAGLLRCAECGHSMRFQGMRDRHGYYRCNDQARIGCPGCNVQAPAIEEIVDGLIADWLDDASDEQAWDAEGSSPASDEIEEGIAKAERGIAKVLALAGDLAEGDEGEEALLAGRLAILRAERAKWIVERAKLKRGEAFADVPAWLTSEAYLAMSVEEKRTLLASVLAAVVVERGVGWRQEVAERVRLVFRDALRDGESALEHVAALRSEASVGMASL